MIASDTRKKYISQMKKKKRIYQKHIQRVKENSGEVVDEYHEIMTQLPSEPLYIKLYIEDLSRLYFLPKSSPELLLELLKKLDYDGLIVLNATSKKMICARVRRSVKTLDNFLHALVKKDVFRRVGTGVFQPNPLLFGRGEWRDIYKRRKIWLIAQYDANGEKKIYSSLSNPSEEEHKHLDADF